MADVFQYYGRLRSAGGGVRALPGWARAVVAVLAMPGVLLVLLSIVLLGVSVLALLLLTLPAYRLLAAVTGSRRPQRAATGNVSVSLADLFGVGGAVAGDASPGRKQVAARVVDAGEQQQ